MFMYNYFTNLEANILNISEFYNLKYTNVDVCVQLVF